jgi:hypothetical protein
MAKFMRRCARIESEKKEYGNYALKIWELRVKNKGKYSYKSKI